jgi:hypothetical protein
MASGKLGSFLRRIGQIHAPQLAKLASRKRERATSTSA